MVANEGRIIILATAHIADLTDDPVTWGTKGNLLLDGFTYERFINAPIDARIRLDWLNLGRIDLDKFYPQPYTQLAKVLREMGHEHDARIVMIEQARLLREHRRHEVWIAATRRPLPQKIFEIPWALFSKAGRALWHKLESLVIGYGFKPFRSLWILLALMTMATLLAHLAWIDGDFAPNSDVVLTSPGWVALAESVDNPAVKWSANDGPGRDWESFNRFAYAIDVVVPVLSLGQTEAWAPSTTRGFWGWTLWWARWFFSIAGWLVTALAAAAVTGIIRRA